MPRFFFNVHDGANLPDDLGVDLPDLQAVRREAVKLAGSLLRDEGDRFWDGTDWRMDVTDAHGTTLFVLRFTGEVHLDAGRGDGDGRG